MSLAKETHEFTGTGRSDPIGLHGKFNLSLKGFGSASVNLERSFDGGSTWWVVGSAYTANFSGVLEEPELDVLYSLNCSSHSSGTIEGRLSQ